VLLKPRHQLRLWGTRTVVMQPLIALEVHLRGQRQVAIVGDFEMDVLWPPSMATKSGKQLSCWSSFRNFVILWNNGAGSFLSYPTYLQDYSLIYEVLQVLGGVPHRQRCLVKFLLPAICFISCRRSFICPVRIRSMWPKPVPIL
jgi:hypothetical protein